MLSTMARIAFAAILAAAISPAQQTYHAPRTPDGTPDLQGIWQAGANAWSGLEAHGGAMGIPAGNRAVVEPQSGGIPHRPQALEKRAGDFNDPTTLDPPAKCHLP